VVARRGFQKGSRENADTPGPPPTPSPVFGQHSEEILAAYGYSAQDIAALRERGAIG
jgi:crotonobetainyl-CoA:carnitine CoA-transferase CaiB-like acyl-CoA transferase